MLYFPPWKTVLVLTLCVAGIVLALPNLFREGDLARLPTWVPAQRVNLGLDLRGGSYLLLRVDSGAVVKEQKEALIDGVRRGLRDARIGYSGLSQSQTDARATLTLLDASQRDAALTILRRLDEDVTVTISDAGEAVLVIDERAQVNRRARAVDQSLEIIRRRIDATGTREPIIQRQGTERILVQLPGVDDPERMKALIGRTAKMTFHLLDETVTPQDIAANRVPPTAMLVPSQNDDGDLLALQRRVAVSGERLTRANANVSQLDSQPVVSFEFDTTGARQFGDITRENVGRRFAIVLDGKVISAPVIREPILGGSGQISGSFTTKEVQEMALLLRAGALPAPLEVIEERSVGPSLGADSVAAGAIASVVSLVLIVVFMTVAYSLFGVFANFALALNVVILIAVLSTIQATLTLPGIAGIVLTMGMAVDANVLIYERIREEVRGGRTMLSAVDSGFSRAMSTIIDSNLTTLTAGVLLYLFGSGPIKGFAVTLSLGIVTSMFTAIMVTRMFVIWWLRARRPSTLPI